jgi:hypothetical protein
MVKAGVMNTPQGAKCGSWVDTDAAAFVHQQVGSLCIAYLLSKCSSHVPLR